MIWCPFCPESCQPDASNYQELRNHLVSIHDGKFIPRQIPAYATTTTNNRHPYNHEKLIHCPCGGLFLNGRGITRHKQHCKCFNHTKHKRIKYDCPCSGCTDPNFPTQATLCTHTCRPETPTPIPELPTSLMTFVNATTFLTPVTTVDLNIQSQTIKHVKIKHKPKVYECYNTIIENMRMIINIPTQHINDKQIHIGNITKLLNLLPSMCLQIIGKNSKVTRTERLEKFLKMEYESIYNHSTPPTPRGNTTPTTKQKIHKCREFIKQGQLSKGFTSLSDETIKDINADVFENLRNKFPKSTSGPILMSDNPPLVEDIKVEELRVIARKTNIHVAPGPSKTRPAFILEPFNKANPTTIEKRFCSNIAWLVTQIANGNPHIAKWMRHGILIGLGKEDPNDIRPIQISEILTRITAKVLLYRYKKEAEECISEHQHAMKKNGIETAVHQFGDFMRQYPNGFAIQTDISNAFNTMSRAHILNLIQQKLPILERFYVAYNGTYFDAFSADNQHISVQEGVRQGCPQSMWAYILGLDPILLQTNDILGDEGYAKAYADDGWILVKDINSAENIKQVYATLEGSLQEIGQKINHSKSCIYTWSSNGTEALKMHSDMRFIPHTEGIKLLGTYQSTNPEWINQQLDKHKMKFEKALQQLNIIKDYPQESMLLLRHCVIPKMIHITRTHPPRYTKDWATILDMMINNTLQKILHLPPNENDFVYDEWKTEYKKARLPTRLGGFGATSIQSITESGYIAGFVAAYTNTQIHKIPEDIFEAFWNIQRRTSSNIQCHPDLQQVIENTEKRKIAIQRFLPENTNLEDTTNFKNSLLQNNAEPFKMFMENLMKHNNSSSKLQNFLTKLEESYRSDAIIGKLSNPNNPRYKQNCANFLSQANSFSTSWSTMIPYAPDTTITPTQYYFLAAQTLGTKLSICSMAADWQLRCNCRASPIIDPFGEHLMACHRTNAHDAVVREIARMCRQAHLTTIIEPIGLMNENRRPDLVIANLSENNKQVLVDFTSVSQLRSDEISISWKKKGYSASKAIERKIEAYHGKYDELTYDFLPLSLEIGGCPSKNLSEFIRQVAKKAELHYNDSTTVPRVYQASFVRKWKSRIVTAFMKTQAQRGLQLIQNVISQRLPNNNLPMEYDDIYLY